MNVNVYFFPQDNKYEMFNNEVLTAKTLRLIPIETVVS